VPDGDEWSASRSGRLARGQKGWYPFNRKRRRAHKQSGSFLDNVIKTLALPRLNPRLFIP